MGGTAGQRRAEKAEREAAKKEGAARSKAKAEEDAYWAAAGEGQKSKAQQRREQADATSDAAAASRAEARRLAKLEEERKGLESEGIPEEQLTLYLGLLERREGEALAELADLICQGCFVSIPRNLYVRIMRGTELVQCPNCNRILYSHG